MNGNSRFQRKPHTSEADFGVRKAVLASAARDSQQREIILEALPCLRFDIVLADNVFVRIPSDLLGEVHDVVSALHGPPC